MRWPENCEPMPKPRTTYEMTREAALQRIEDYMEAQSQDATAGSYDELRYTQARQALSYLQNWL